MRCKKHDTDLSSITGVCASCLRERLCNIILAQERENSQSIQQNSSNFNTDANPIHRRSVSPYLSHRNSIHSVNPATTVQRPYNKPRLNHSLSDKRFYNSPQIAINTGGCIGSSSSNRRKPNLVRFPSISNLFKSNSRNSNGNGNGNGNGDANSNPRISVSNSSESCGAAGRSSSVTSTPSWFSGAGGRRNSKAVYVDERRCVRDRGMSPVRYSDDELSDGTSGYETAESCKLTPMKTPATNRRGGGNKSVAELIFCPLVRASPSRLLSLKGRSPVDGGFSGDVRAPAVPHLAYAKSFCGNRSRKLADFGRSDSHR